MATDNSQLIEQRLPDNTSEKITPADVRAVAHALDQQAPNQRRGGPFFVIYLTHAEALAAGRGDNASLDQLDPALLCLGCLARVDLHPDQYGQVLLLGFDPRPDPAAGLRVQLDGGFSGAYGGAVPVKWYPVDSRQAQEANVPLLDPLRNYPQDFQVREVYGGVSYQFFSRNGGAHPAPPDYLGDSNWGPATPPPPPPTASSDLRPLGYAQYMLSRYPDAIRAGLLYLLPSGEWNGATGAPPGSLYDEELVEVEGGQNGFARLGTVRTFAGQRLPVTVDVAAGTYSTSIGTGAGGGGNGYTDAQAQQAARQLLLDSVQSGVAITDDPQTGQLAVTNTVPNLKELYFEHPAPGTGNLLRRFFKLRYAAQEGSYTWVADENISQVELSFGTGQVIYSGSIVDFRPLPNSFLFTQSYSLVLTPIDSTKPVVLELLQQY